MWVRSLGWEDPLEEGMATHSVFLPGESYGQRSLVGYSPWGCKESDTTEMTVLVKRGRVLTLDLFLPSEDLKRQLSINQEESLHQELNHVAAVESLSPIEFFVTPWTVAH